MPVALVNSDRGAVVSGKQVNAGDEIVKSLIANGGLDWHVVDPEQARNGVEHGEYYFMLELPPNFSEAIASPQTGQPEKADLVVVYNDANNYISSSIGQTAISQVLNAVSTPDLRAVRQSGSFRTAFVRRGDQAGRRRGRTARHRDRAGRQRRRAAGVRS